MLKLLLNNRHANEHYNTVNNILRNRINKVLKIGYIGRGPNKIHLDVSIQNYLSDLINNNTLNDLIVCEPSDLINIITYVNINHPDFIIPKSNNNLILRNIFVSHGYDNNLFSKLQFIEKINIDTCPYCNRNYIYCLTRNGGLKPQIDHFYPKSIYPFFGLSYYNLIPSCQTCNGFGAKEENDPLSVDLINPYLLENDNFRFTFKIKSINFINPLLDKSSIEIYFKYKIQGHLDVFKLDKLYNQHTDHALELIVKSQIAYSQTYRNYLKSYVGFTFSENEIDRMILGNYSLENEIHKRPLAKLYQDIGKELNLIK